jgi:tRNA-Thr(GGU) m(6)t(6)A37 methyltransferase TsaA
LQIEPGALNVKIEVAPIGFVTSDRLSPEDDYWGGKESRITLVSAFSADALEGLTTFSHVQVIYYFHQVDAAKIETGARHPRNNPAWPSVGIFAQRAKNRPNRLGTTICRLLGVDGTTVRVTGLDAIDGTPVLDIKPVMREFLPADATRQPAWSHELMGNYWIAR